MGKFDIIFLGHALTIMILISALMSVKIIWKPMRKMIKKTIKQKKKERGFVP
jgi:hypothetical protein